MGKNEKIWYNCNVLLHPLVTQNKIISLFIIKSIKFCTAIPRAGNPLSSPGVSCLGRIQKAYRYTDNRVLKAWSEGGQDGGGQ